MHKIWLALSLSIISFFSLSAKESVTGIVTDPEGTPIQGANILVTGSIGATTTDAQGKFVVELDIMPASFLTITHISYQPAMVRISRNTPLRVTMTPAIYPMQGVTVTADRAEFGKTPIAFTDFTSEEIERDYQLGEFPLLLETTPNLYAYSDAGGGLGYSYLKIRGFDDKRVSVYINGVPLNDPEDQATYFVDIPDFAANVKDIQVQRGIGNSLYGDASFGGSVNIVSAGLEQERQVTLSSGYGSFWNEGEFIGYMQKQSIAYVSGLIDGRWNFAGRYSRQLSDGYRDRSWYDGWSYFLSLSRLDPRISTTLNLYGGPMKMHLAYYGISRDQIRSDRRYNPLRYENETDNFNQPHYELHNTIKLSDQLTLDNTLYHIHGEGFYEQYKDDRKFSDFNITPTVITDEAGDTVRFITRGDLVRQQWVEKNQWGWTPQFDLRHSRGNLSIGGSFYYFESEHWGQVVWGEGVTNQIAPRHRYYEYFGKKYFVSLSVAENYRLSDKLNLMANLQFRRQTYDFDQTRLGAFAGYDYDVDWNFISPRLGLNYAITDKANVMFNYSLSSRAPTDYEIYDAGDPYALPSLEIKTIKFASSTDSSLIFGDPTANAERVHDLEAGINYHDQRQTHSLNLYWMDFRDEIVPYGGINPDLGLPITTNVDRSIHAGIEISSARKIGESFKLSGNFSYSYNRIKNFRVTETQYDNDADFGFVESKSYIYDNKTIAGFPNYLGNFIGEFNTDRLHLTFRERFVGRIFVENNNRKELAIDPYALTSFSAKITLGNFISLGALSLTTRVDNLFDKKYEASGYGGVTRFRDVADQYWAEYIPAAGRSFFSSLQLELK